MQIKTICSLQTRKAMACAVYETAPTSLEWKLQLAVRLTCEKTWYAAPDWTYCFSHMWGHLIGLHRFSNENLLCGFSVCKSHYYIDESVLLGTKPLVDLIRHFIRMSPLWVSYRSMTSGLSLKLYLNSLVYHRNIFRSSSEVFGNLRKFSEILGKCSGTFVWYLEQLWKIFGNFRKVVGNLRNIIKNAVISMSI